MTTDTNTRMHADMNTSADPGTHAKTRTGVLGARIEDAPDAFKHAMRVAVIIAIVITTTVTCSHLEYFGIPTAASGNTSPSWYTEDAQSEYDELAEALLSGSMQLPEEPPTWLDAMDNPYDTEARDVLEEQTGELYKWDWAYFEGHYYVYFGIVPCLLFFVPYHLITGGGLLPTGIPVLVTLIAYIIGLAALLSSIAKSRFPRVRIRDALIAFAGAFLCSGLVYAASYPSLYQIPATTSLAFSIWGLFFWWRAYESDRTSFYAAGSVCIALLLGCRPPMVAVALFGLFPLVRLLKRENGRIARFCALALPFLVAAAGVCAYNYARFGSPLNFGATYNLTAVDLTTRSFNLAQIPVGLYHYLIQLPELSASVPFLLPVDLSYAFSTGNFLEDMPGGILACMPFLWTVFFCWYNKSARWSILSVLCAVCVCVILVVADAMFGGIAGRYQMDFCFLFAVAAGVAALELTTLDSGTSNCGAADRNSSSIGSAQATERTLDGGSRLLSALPSIGVVLALLFNVALILFLMV